MLFPGAAVAIPAVVGQVDNRLGAALHILTHFIWKNRLIADKNAKRLPACIQRFAGVSPSEVSDLVRQHVHEWKETFERNVFAKGHEMCLVIARRQVAIGTD